MENRIAIVKDFENGKYLLIDNRIDGNIFFDNYRRNMNISYYNMIADIHSSDINIINHTKRILEKCIKKIDTLQNTPYSAFEVKPEQIDNQLNRILKEIKETELIYNEISFRRKLGYPNDNYSDVRRTMEERGLL